MSIAMHTALRPRLGQWPTLLGTCTRHFRAVKGPRSPAAEDHGEKIWVFCHRRTDQVIYSVTYPLRFNHGMEQLPFNGKKSKPATLRKDYWSVMARIDLPKKQGEVGLSVYQKLRELKHLHEVCWGDEVMYKSHWELTDSQKKKYERRKAEGKFYGITRTKQERAEALNRQKPNVIADMAVVLSGQGKGNKMVLTSDDGARDESEAPKLVPVTIRWVHDFDKEYAESWPANVTHEEYNPLFPTKSEYEVELGALQGEKARDAAPTAT
ncbi:hypothetical protein E4U13_001254 [Claviceps humidiphila]|uniref:Large ribosomal subunit protein mL67 n=1 Tax=Claviceps humidiphila TaxID=1294629 RepID=A0A9P7Q3Y3_9HYPO|nr:hypothetical protein E4U13_001254 [Claviceps humidiphila]